MGNMGNPKLTFTRVDGTPLETVASVDSTDAYSGFLQLNKLTGATVNAWYNTIYLKCSSGVNNIHVGVYDDNAGSPNNLLVDSGSIANPNNYVTAITVSEFQATTSTLWIAVLDQNTDALLLYDSLAAQTSGNIRYKAAAFGALPNPAGAGYTSYTRVTQMKIDFI